MALFLTRAAGPAGISLPAPSDQGFTDIGGLSAATQDAINQIAALGITKGTSSNTYSPDDPVTRQQMALFLIRFLDDAGVTFDFGITKGTSTTEFSPNANVTREQMAAFVARTLAHTNAAPAGIAIQADPTSGDETVAVAYKITVRDSSHAPVPFALVDAFYVTDPAITSPFATDGTCDADATLWLAGATKCKIELADHVMDIDGNKIAATVLPAAVDKSWQIWVWTGDVNDEFDNDTTASDSVTLTGNTPMVLGWDVDTSWNGTDNLHFGESVTWTFQLIDTADANAKVAEAGVDIDVVYSRLTYVDAGLTTTELGLTQTIDAAH